MNFHAGLLAMKAVAICLLASVAGAINLRAPAEDQCVKGFEGATPEAQCDALVLQVQGKTEKFTAFTSEAKRTKEEECEYIRGQLKDLEEAEVRCEHSQTCTPRLKKMLPDMQEYFKKQEAEKC